MTACPSSETIQQLLEGTLAEEQACAVGDHLTACSRCRDQLDRLSGAQELERWAPACRGRGEVFRGPALEDVLARLTRLVPAAPWRPDGLEGPVLSSLSFLAPPLYPEDLGTLGPYRVL